MADDIPPASSSTGRTGWWTRLFQGRVDESVDRKEIISFLGECRLREVLDGDEYMMLMGVLEVSETQVREIMVPRSRMVVLSHDASPDELLKIIVESRHSRFPVIGEDRDEVVGIVLAKDVLKQLLEQGGTIRIAELLRPAAFIPESKRLNTLLTEFRQSHNHMAIVVDEYGGVAGLATIEDVLEEIVGDIDDEHDPEEAQSIVEQEPGRFVVQGLTRIEQFNEFFHANFSDEEYETIGGLVIHELGRLPRRGEQLDFQGFSFKVVRGDRRRVQTVEVTRLDSEPA
ncbi:MAG TPA: transporter associated domain-containing protein [Gammaproteobacteria bacterium]